MLLWRINTQIANMGQSSLEGVSYRGKVMSQEANKLQMPFLANSIYSRDPISKMSINCRSPFCASNKATSLDINCTQSEINDWHEEIRFLELFKNRFHVACFAAAVSEQRK